MSEVGVMEATIKGNRFHVRKGKTLRFRVPIIVERDEPGFHAYSPALKGLHMGGDTKEEALSNARDAAIAYLESLLTHGDPIPLYWDNAESSANLKDSDSYQIVEVKVSISEI